MPTINRETVIQLVGLGLGTSYDAPIPKDIDWELVLALGSEQGVGGICLEGIEKLPSGMIPKGILLQWIGQTEVQRQQYQHAWEVACRLDKFWADNDIHATVLKGRSVAQYYPVPHHRYSCDLDIFIEKDWKKACKLLESKGIALEHEVYKEVEFTLDDVYVECHRYITPLRGNKHLQSFERYLRSLLNSEQTTFFDGTTLGCPPLMFNVMLYVEHALGDFLHGKLLLKHIVDWVVLRKQDVDWKDFEARCKEFKFDRFVSLIDALADVVEGKKEYDTLQPAYQKAFEEMFQEQEYDQPRTWFQRRMHLFFDILKNGKTYRDYGYTSMPSFLFHSMWTHFFDKEVKL